MSDKEDDMTEADQKTLLKFTNLRYPEHYKFDMTDNILFLEFLQYDICPFLLKGKKITPDMMDYLLKQYSTFLAQTEIRTYDKDLVSYIRLVNEVVGAAINCFYYTLTK